MRGFLLQALKANTEAMGRLAERGDKQDGKLDGIVGTLHSIDKRLTVIENNSIERDVKKCREDLDAIDKRLAALEAIENQRKGAMGLWDWFRKSWPAIVGLIAIVAVILNTNGKWGG